MLSHSFVPFGMLLVFITLYSSRKSMWNLQQRNSEKRLFQFGLTLNDFWKLKKISLRFYFIRLSLFPAAVPEGIVYESPDITTIILILLAVIILAVLIVFFLIFSRRRRKNKAKGIFCYPLYCTFGFQNCMWSNCLTQWCFWLDWCGLKIWGNNVKIYINGLVSISSAKIYNLKEFATVSLLAFCRVKQLLF